ncbi:hypothetical protein [Methylococcus sp. Mc7]|uniref:hypothetical protein n=1 Tax=Methylococcus sp. Mc7 TaxID=2860258 RepID=UPI001C53399A|nr:hypothetical protein [Methylococcus sp. Mc7]QXP83835.1 hypothetical protein KW115_17100 [Methylococcus sp. Mc7]
MNYRLAPPLLLGLAVLSGCAGKIPKEALALSQESLQVRQLETRRFATRDEAQLLSASSALLQDMGFTLEEVNAPLGILVGQKTRDARRAGQIAGAVLLALITRVPMPTDSYQIMRASLVTRPQPNGKETAVRITFQRIVYDTQERVTAAEPILEPEIYQEFFAKLSKSVFLEAQQI